METIIITLTKKGAKYYHGLQNGYHATLNIDEESELHDLPLDIPLRLIVNNLSIKSEYGTKLHYSIHQYMFEIMEAGIVPISFMPGFYNTLLSKHCREIAGVFNYESKEWQFWPYFKEQAEELIYSWMSTRVILPVCFPEAQTILSSRITYCGETVCFFTDTYKEVLLLGDNTKLISGRISVKTHKRKVHLLIEENTVVTIKVPIHILTHQQKKSVKSGIPYQFDYDDE